MSDTSRQPRKAAYATYSCSSSRRSTPSPRGSASCSPAATEEHPDPREGLASAAEDRDRGRSRVPAPDWARRRGLGLDRLAGDDVVDHRVGTDRADEVDVRTAADAGHLGTEHLGDLDREGADSAGRTVDQNLLPRLYPSPVPDGLQYCDAAGGKGGGLLEGDRGRLADERAARAARELGEAAAVGGAAAPSEDLITRAQIGDPRADLGDRARHLRSPDTMPRSA